MSKVAKFVAADVGWLRRADDPALSVGDIYWDMVAWVKLPNPAATTNFLVCKNNVGNGEYYLYTTGSKFRIVVRRADDATSYGVTATTFGAIPANTWCMVHVYYDPVADVLGISVNGGAHNTAASPGGIRDSTSTFDVGAFPGGGHLANVAVGPLAVWKPTDTNLTVAQLKQLYRGGFGLTFANLDAGLLAGLQVWYQMDEAMGDRVDAVAALNLVKVGSTVFFEESLLDIPMPTVHW